MRTLTLGIAVVLVSANFCAAQHPELARLHVLLVCDTNDPMIGKSVKLDRSLMEALLANFIPKSRYHVTVLAGNDVSAANILDYYRRLPTNRSEAVLFYYSGHGATHPQKGHFLALGQNPLFRADLRRAILERDPGLTIMLTDCCSNFIAIPKPKKTLGLKYAQTLHPLARNLFFQHRGVVDLTASTDDFAYGTDEVGGFFTRALFNTFFATMDRLDGNGDGFVTWNEYFRAWHRETGNVFTKSLGKQEAASLKTQSPRAFETGLTGDLTKLSKRTYVGADAKRALQLNKENKGWLPWESFEEPGQNLVLFRRVKSIASSISVQSGQTVSVTVGPEYQWKRVKR